MPAPDKAKEGNHLIYIIFSTIIYFKKTHKFLKFFCGQQKKIEHSPNENIMIIMMMFVFHIQKFHSTIGLMNYNFWMWCWHSEFLKIKKDRCNSLFMLNNQSSSFHSCIVRPYRLYFQFPEKNNNFNQKETMYAYRSHD